jgi:pyruvate,water dikinase
VFSIDTETGFDRVVLINAAWGLGENVVQGTIDPDDTKSSSRSLLMPR